MVNFSKTVAYRGIPIGFKINDSAEWGDFLPMAGPVEKHTVIYAADNVHPRRPSYYYDRNKTLESLRRLARQGNFYKNLINDTQDLYDDLADKIPVEQFEPGNSARLSENERKEFIDIYLSPAGVVWISPESEDCHAYIIEYVSDICVRAEIPHYDEYIYHKPDLTNHRVLGFSTDGSEITAQDHDMILAGFKDFYSYVYGEVYDIFSPSGPVSAIPYMRGLQFNDPDSCDSIKKIETGIDGLLNNKNGDYGLTVPYAHSPKSLSECHVTFDPDQTITLRFKTLKEAKDLANYWSEFGQSIEPQRIKEKE